MYRTWQAGTELLTVSFPFVRRSPQEPRRAQEPLGEGCFLMLSYAAWLGVWHEEWKKDREVVSKKKMLLLKKLKNSTI